MFSKARECRCWKEGGSFEVYGRVATGSDGFDDVI